MKNKYLAFLMLFFMVSFLGTTALFAQSNKVTGVISKDTTEKELKNLQDFFENHDITLKLNTVKYNKDLEIVALNLSLSKDGSTSRYASSSNFPIQELELGYQDGGLFIRNTATSAMASVRKSLKSWRSFSIDSLMAQHGMHFGLNADSFNLGDAMNFDNFQDQMQKLFDFSGNADGDNEKPHKGIHPKKNFDPKKQHASKDSYVDKWIIIDGEPADLETFEELSKNDKIQEIDYLKPETARSIYGNKAKDGAVIATTKKS